MKFSKIFLSRCRSYARSLTLWQWTFGILCLVGMGTIYWLYDMPVIIAAARKFFTKTIPAFAKATYKMIPRIVGKALANRYVKKIATLLAIRFASEAIIDRFTDVEVKCELWMHRNFVKRPQAFWRRRSVASRVIICVIPLGILVTLLGFGVELIGYFIVLIDVIVRIAAIAITWIARKMAPKLIGKVILKAVLWIVDVLYKYFKRFAFVRSWHDRYEVFYEQNVGVIQSQKIARRKEIKETLKSELEKL